MPLDVIVHLAGRDPGETKQRTLGEQVAFFHLVLVALDPYTYESSWLLETAGRILQNFSGADCRVGFLLTSDEKGAREFVGPWADELLLFVDEDRSFVKALGIGELPAFVHIEHDGTIAGKAEGWDPDTWRPIAEHLAELMSWSRPAIPKAGDPVPFDGTPAIPA